MFDPGAHFDNLKHLLAGCETWAEVTGPTGAVPRDAFGKWKWGTWRIEIKFVDGCNLIALESYSLRKGNLLRKVKYRFTKGSGDLIVQVDTHGGLVPFDEAPHLHLPNRKDRVYEDDPLLKTYPLKDYDFHKMWALVETYIKGGGLPWPE